MAVLYANADVFVHPNPNEPFGIAPLEAMASGLPLVAPDSGGVMTYANSQNSWTTPPRTESFAAAIEEIAGNEFLRRQKVERALETAREYAWPKVAASFLDLYSELNDAMNAGRSGNLSPDFVSSPPTGFERLLFHGITQSAQQTFRGVSRAFTKSEPPIGEHPAQG